MIRSILVPLDGSAFGECALPLATTLARRAGATLHLAHVHSAAAPLTPAGMAIREALDYHLLQGEQSYLFDVARRVSEKSVAVRTALLEGDVAAGLKAYALRESIDLVVLSTHARGAFERFWLGSVADDLAHDLPQPILLVPAHEGPAGLVPDAALRSVVVALDGTVLAEKVLGPALELCQLFGAELHLVRVNRPVALPGHLLDGGGSLVQILEQMEQQGQREAGEARNYLDALAANLAARGARVRTRVVTEKQPAAGLLNEARADRADLIALETHGRRGFARLFMGSVADRVVRGGTVPVLLQHSGS
jgi:nucleotide-binding universal stress UspA family protein